MFDESFWVAISFILFIALIYKPVAKFIASTLDKRIKEIGDELNRAQTLCEEAESLVAQGKQKLSQAENEALEIMNYAEKQAKTIITKSEQEAEIMVRRKTEQAMKRIAQAEIEAIAQVKDNAMDIAVSAARVLIAENLSREAAEQLLNEAIEDIGRKYH